MFSGQKFDAIEYYNGIELTKFDYRISKDQKTTNQIIWMFCMLFIALIKCNYDKSIIDWKNVRIIALHTCFHNNKIVNRLI